MLVIGLLFVVLCVLAVAYFVGRALRRQPESTASPAVVQTFNQRVLAWLLTVRSIIRCADECKMLPTLAPLPVIRIFDFAASLALRFAPPAAFPVAQYR